MAEGSPDHSTCLKCEERSDPGTETCPSCGSSQMVQGDAGVDHSDPEDPFEGHRVMDVEVTSNLADGATIDVNGTQLKIFQNNPHVPVLAEIWVEDEPVPLGSINTARRKTVTLGGIEEGLADRVDEIRELPVDEIPAALEKLAFRLNPAGREKPESMSSDDGCPTDSEGDRPGGESA